jgi:hypothetical protein
MRVNSLFNKYSKWFKSLTVLALVGTSLVSCQKSPTITYRNKNVLTYQDYLEDRRIMSQTLRELYENYFYSGGWRDFEFEYKGVANSSSIKKITKNYRASNIKLIFNEDTNPEAIELIKIFAADLNNELRYLGIPKEIINISEDVYMKQDFRREELDFIGYNKDYVTIIFRGTSDASYLGNAIDCSISTTSKDIDHLCHSNLVLIKGLNYDIKNINSSQMLKFKTVFFHELTHVLGFSDIYTGEKFIDNKIFWENESLNVKYSDSGIKELQDPGKVLINFVYDYSIHLKKGHFLRNPELYNFELNSKFLGKFDSEYMKYLYQGTEIRRNK